ncbi:MAG TPA: DNA polymerase III subunit delta, partial [Candidatus Aphodocola excrementigallinarum]|nr:DNA polymerase III subunit delta [Candidatus Aphodocola excrementigallinarum]
MNTYLIYGNDYSLIKREIDKITKEINDVTTYDLSLEKVDNLLNDASVISMFGDKKALIGENALFLSTSSSSINHDLDYLQRYLEDDNHDNIVIFTLNENKLDERKKIVKLLKKRATVIHKDVIKDKDLPDFVRDEFFNNGYKIDYKAASYFVQYAGSNVDILISEINKMMMYKDGDKIIKIEDINEITSKKMNDNIFDLSNAIMDKNFKKMYECYNDLMTLKEEPIKIIAMLGSTFTLVYQCKLLYNDGKRQNEIADILKVHPYRVKLAIE